MRRSMFLAGLLGLWSCKPGATPQAEPATADSTPTPAAATTIAPSKPIAIAPVAPETEKSIAQSINDFGVEYYKRASSGDGNIVVSPASISLAFAMTYAGAKGETADEIKTAFHYSLEGDALFGGFGATLARWNASKDVQLSVANRLFGETTFDFAPPFITLTERFFGAGLQGMDFKGSPENSRVSINDWVEAKTHNRIKDLLPVGSLTPITRLVLANAVYFKADWSTKFESESTGKAVFRAPGGDVRVPMMRRTQTRPSVPYYADDKLSVVELAYKGGTMSMLFVLPAADDGLTALEASLSAELVDKWASSVRPASLSLQIPVFRVAPAKSVSLKETLMHMGVVRAFDTDSAQFDGMATHPKRDRLFISDAFHKAFIEVNEEGTEAAAATAVVMARGTGAPQVPDKTFVADHPFLFLLRDRTTGAVLFIGRVNDPSADAAK